MLRLASLMCAAIVLGLNSISSFGASLTTIFATDNSASANVFDVAVVGSPLLVTSLALNLSSGTHTIALYTKPGTWVGSDNTAAAWTLVDTVADVASNGPDNATLVDFSDFVLAANATTGLYISVIDPAGINDLLYTDGTGVGNIAAANSDLEILEGAGKQATLFSGPTFVPRIWNGMINYTVVPIPPALILYGSAIGFLGWIRRKRV